MTYQIFISYRRDGGETLAALLYDRLRQRGFQVFYDVESLRSGEFNRKLLNVIEECEDVLLVLPPGGLDRCINNPQDWVRQEIEHALKNGKNVIPVLMRNFEFPEHLPASMAELPNLNGISANMEFFDAVIDRIVDKRLISRSDGETAGNIKRELTPELMRNAMELKIPEAMEELAAMYHEGNGVARNLEEEITLRKRVIEVRKENDAKNPGEENAELLFVAYEKLGELLNGAERFQEAYALYEEMYQFAQALTHRFDSDFARNREAFCCDKLGINVRGYEDAEAWYRKGLEIREDLVIRAFLSDEETGDGFEIGLIENYRLLGDLAREQFKAKEAREWYQKELDRSERFLTDTDSFCAKEHVADSYGHLMLAEQMAGDYETAKEYGWKWLNLLEEMNRKNPTIEVSRRSGYAWLTMGNLMRNSGNYAEARIWYQKALTIRESLLKDRKLVVIREEVAGAEVKLGELAEAELDLEGAKVWFQKAYDQYSRIRTESDTLNHCLNLGHVCISLGQNAEKREKFEEAKAWYQEVMDLYTGMTSESALVKVQDLLSLAYEGLSRCAQNENNFTLAEDYSRKELVIIERLAAVSNDPKYLNDLNAVYGSLATVIRKQGNLSEAEKLYRKSLAGYEKRAKETNSIDDQRRLGISYQQMGILKYEQEKYSEAKGWFSRAVDTLQKLRQRTDWGVISDELARYQEWLRAAVAKEKEQAAAAARPAAAVCEPDGQQSMSKSVSQGTIHSAAEKPSASSGASKEDTRRKGFFRRRK